MIVSQILKAKGSGVSTVRAEARVFEAVTRLAKERIGALVVVGGAGEVIGIISERDVVQALARLGAAALEEPIEALMSQSVATCAPDDSIESLMREMTARRVRHLPVVKDTRLAGMISIGDVVKYRLDELERERAMLVQYVANA